MMMTFPVVQSVIRISEGFDGDRVPEPLRAGEANARVRPMLKSPMLGLNIHIQRIALATAGITVGR